MSPINFPGEVTGKCTDTTDKLAVDLPGPDVVVLTSGGLRIPVHSQILAMASPVIEKILEKPKRNRKTGEKAIPILGVPCDAVSAFVRFIYSSSCTTEEMEKYGVHLLALSHVFSVPKLKHRCTKGLAEMLTVESVVDVLQLARLCDAPELYLKGMKMVAGKFKVVEKTEGWKFVQKHDPWLELEILQFMEEMELRRKRSKKHKEEQNLYLQLSEAMDCLVHICTEGCTSVGPYDMEPSKKEPCTKFVTCRGLQLLIKHFAACKKRVNDGCSRCKRMWQLLKLHASLCDQPDLCRVPLCRQFKLKMQQEKKKGDEAKWKLLVRKVLLAKTISSLSMAQGEVSTKLVKHPSLHCDGINFKACLHCP